MKNKIITIIILTSAFAIPVLAESKDELIEEFNIITEYYKNPQPQKLGNLLEKFIDSELFKSDEIDPEDLIYPFGLAAKSKPLLIEKYKQIFENTSHEGRIYILKILQICGNSQVEKFLTSRLSDSEFAMEKPAISKALEEGIPKQQKIVPLENRTGRDLDMFWTEFLITGDKKSVSHIIDTLGIHDRIRSKLEKYLSEAPAKEKKDFTSLLKNELGIYCDLSNNSIKINHDLDMHIAMFLKYQSKDKPGVFREIMNSLKLEDDDIMYLADKSSAQWSLESNSGQHEKVLQVCEKEVEIRKGKTKIALLEILSSVYSDQLLIDKAIRTNQQRALLDPYNPVVHVELERGYIWKKDVKSAKKELDMLLELGAQEDYNHLKDDYDFLVLSALETNQCEKTISTNNAAGITSKVNKTTESINSYRSYMTFTDLTQENKFKGFFTIEWDIEYVKPDKISVTQIAWEQKGSVGDRWITIGKQHYFQIGMWFKEPIDGANNWRDKTNQYLKIDKWIYLINNNSVKSIESFKCNEKQYTVLKFSPNKLMSFELEAFGEDFKQEAEIWIDNKTSYIAKATLDAKGKSRDEKPLHIKIVQVIKDYNSAIEIKEPDEDEILDLTKK